MTRFRQVTPALWILHLPSRRPRVFNRNASFRLRIISLCGNRTMPYKCRRRARILGGKDFLHLCWHSATHCSQWRRPVKFMHCKIYILFSLVYLIVSEATLWDWAHQLPHFVRKMHQIQLRFRFRLRPDRTGRCHRAPPYTLAAFRERGRADAEKEWAGKGRRGRGNDKCYRATQGSDGDTGRIKEGREILRK